MRSLLLTAVAACTLAVGIAPATAQSPADQRRWDAAQARFDRETQIYRTERDRYESSRGGYRDRRSNGYDGRADGYPGTGYPASGYPTAGSPYDDDRFATDYDASRHYRAGPGYQERVLADNDQVYRGSDGRYYCQRTDGTTGLIIGGATGGILGNVIDGGRHRGAGTLIGGALGALLGRSVQQQNDQVRCR